PTRRSSDLGRRARWRPTRLWVIGSKDGLGRNEASCPYHRCAFRSFERRVALRRGGCCYKVGFGLRKTRREPRPMRRTIPALLSALIAVGSLLGAAPPAADAQQDAAAPEEALFFAMQIADESGAILAEPKLLGLPGVPLQMKLWQPGGTRQSRMDLWLEPAANDDGSYAVSFELSV